MAGHCHLAVGIPVLKDGEDVKSKRILVLDELQSIYLSACNHHYICSSFVKEWIDFQYRATTEGVSQFDIDQYILSDDQFESKYKGT